MRPDQKRDHGVKSLAIGGLTWLGNRIASGLGVAITSAVTLAASTYLTRWVKYWLGE